MRVDLHIHSNYSDSSRSPEEIVSVAKNKNVGLISVCDHATIDSFNRLSKACKDNNINFVLGVELGAIWENNDLHVLAYNFDKHNVKMKTLINQQYQDSDYEYIVYNMSLDYPQMSLDDYRNFERPEEKGWKYLYYAVAKGVASTYEEANLNIYGKYSTPNHLSSSYNLHDLCSIVKQANGVSVLAHPGYLHEHNPDIFFKLLKDIKNYGMEGIECYYPQHSKTVTDICVDFCKNNDLRITGGCDCHGDYDKLEEFKIGALDISLDILDLKGII